MRNGDGGGGGNNATQFQMALQKLLLVICRNCRVATQQSRRNIAPTVNYSCLNEKPTPSGHKGEISGVGLISVAGWDGSGEVSTCPRLTVCIVSRQHIPLTGWWRVTEVWRVVSSQPSSETTLQRHLLPHFTFAFWCLKPLNGGVNFRRRRE